MSAPLRSWTSDKVEVREHGVSGKGLFATEPLEKGEIVFVKGGHIVDWDECQRLAERFGDYYLQITDELFLAPKTEQEARETAICINHSCDPNVAPAGQVVFRTMQEVAAGEELQYDYAMTTAHPYELRCDCESDRCRGTVTGEDWRREELQERYDGMFSNFIQRKIDQREDDTEGEG